MIKGIGEAGDVTHIVVMSDDPEDIDTMNVSLFKVLKPFDIKKKSEKYMMNRGAVDLILGLMDDGYIESIEFLPMVTGPFDAGPGPGDTVN